MSFIIANRELSMGTSMATSADEFEVAKLGDSFIVIEKKGATAVVAVERFHLMAFLILGVELAVVGLLLAHIFPREVAPNLCIAQTLEAKQALKPLSARQKILHPCGIAHLLHPKKDFRESEKN